MRTFIPTVLALVAAVSFTSPAEACRCAWQSVPNQIAAADVILSGETLWTYVDGSLTYAAIRFDRVLKVSNDVGTFARIGLQKHIDTSQVAFFRADSDSHGSCNGTSVVMPVKTRVTYFAKRKSDGELLLTGEPINTCSMGYSFITESSPRYAEVRIALSAK